MPIKPSRPGFEPKGGKKKPAPKGSKENPPVPAKRPRQETPKPEGTRRKKGDVPTPKVIPAPKEMTTPPFRHPRKVTGGPFLDSQAKYNTGWTVITRAGDLVEYHRFRTEEEARTFAEAVGK